MNFTVRDAVNQDTATVRDLIAEVLAEYGLALDPLGVDADLGDLEGQYTARGGLFWIVEVPGRGIVGCCGLYPLSTDDVELRKMYLRANVRGHGIGRQLLNTCIAEARDRGWRRIVLETATVLTEAIALYRQTGFTQIEHTGHATRCDQAWALVLEPAH